MRHVFAPPRAVRPLEQRGGAVLILALLLLAMVTVMGIYSATRSSIEQRIAGNMRANMEVFFAAEAGLSHARTLLARDFQTGNQTKLATGTEPDWDFLLDSSTLYPSVAATYFCGPVPSDGSANNGCADGASLLDGVWTTNGLQVLSNTIQSGNLSITYTVTAWDNIDYLNNMDTADDDTNPVDDTDGVIYMRSVAVATIDGSEVGRAIMQMTLEGQVSNPMSFDDPVAQSNFGPGKASAGRDIDEIDVGDLASGQAL